MATHVRQRARVGGLSSLTTGSSPRSVGGVGDTSSMPRTDLAAWRMVAQGLATPDATTPERVVAQLGAVQAQDLPGAITSVALRLAEPSWDQVVAAINAGHIVRSWPLRGSLHFMLPAELDAIVRITAPRMLAESAGRRRQLGIGTKDLDDAAQLASDALANRAALSRADLFALWREHGLPLDSARATHILRVLCQQRVLVLGPMIGTDQGVVSYQGWISGSSRDTSQALVDLARSYFTGHGPATATDFSRWAGLTMADTRAGIDGLGAEFSTEDRDGQSFVMRADLADRYHQQRSATTRVMLLPGFDEFILGYADRTFTIHSTHADRIVPGNNGVFKPTIIHRGAVVGVWKRVGPKASPRLEATWFGPVSAAVERRAHAAFEALPRPLS